jgi:hypothetical protein
MTRHRQRPTEKLVPSSKLRRVCHNGVTGSLNARAKNGVP